MPLEAGKLKHRIALYKPNPEVTRGSTGQPIRDPQEVATVWAAIEPLTAGELFRGQQAIVGVTHRLTIRYRSDIRETWKATYQDPLRGERTFELVGIRDPEETREFLEILARE